VTSSPDSDPEDPVRKDALRLRAATFEALSPANLHSRLEELQTLARSWMRGLPAHCAVDLVEEFLRPWCLRLAVLITNAHTGELERLTALASLVMRAAADPDDAELQTRASLANDELNAHFPPGLLPLRDSGFVALSQTLPCLLANLWLILLEHPAQTEWLREHPARLPQAIEELMRLGGLTRIILRTATRHVDVNGVKVSLGDRVLLRVNSANRDPSRFPDPDRPDFGRTGVRHLTLGAGDHSCTGVALIGAAVRVATAAFLDWASGARLAGAVEWQGGAGFQYPGTLVVQLGSSSD
jgi:cytochrome P450